MEYLLEISKIIESAVACDRRRVLGYLDQLIRKLKRKGDAEACLLLEQCAQSSLINFSSGPVVGLSEAGMPKDKDSHLSLLDESNYSISDIPIILPATAANVVEEFLACVESAAKLQKNGMAIAPSMLIYGSPGVGKSETAKYISAKLGLPLLTARTDSLISSYLGNTSKNLRLVFEYAAKSPCVLFLDEFDAIAKQRDDSQELGELKRVVIGLLQNLDVWGKDTILIAATNHEHLLDPAIWRRFAFKLQLPLPARSERSQMIKVFLGDYKIEEPKLRRVVEMTEGMSGSELRDICHTVIRHAVLKDRREIDFYDLIRVCIMVSLGTNFSFDIKDREAFAGFVAKFGKALTQSDVAILYSASKATISRRMKELEAERAE